MPHLNLTAISSGSEYTYNIVEETPVLDINKNQYLDTFKVFYKPSPISSDFEEAEHELIPIRESTGILTSYLASRLKFFLGTASPKTNEPKQNIRKTLISFIMLDEYKNINIQKQDINDAISFLNMLPENCILPVPILADDGEISFNWSKNGFHIDVIFTGNCCYSYFAKDYFSEKYYGDDISILGRFPAALSKLLMDFSIKYDEF